MLQPRRRQRRPYPSLILLPIVLHLVFAQDVTTPPPLDIPTITPVSPSYLPLASDNAGYAPNNPQSTVTAISSDEDDSHHDGLLNYYFLLLAIFVVVILAVYWSLSRKRKASLARQRNTQQDALARDLSGSGWRTVPERLRRHYGGSRDLGSREEEGLNERGEAPPPYLKEPEQAHVDRRERADGVELRPWSREEDVNVKPPDYEERSADRLVESRNTDLRRPS